MADNAARAPRCRLCVGVSGDGEDDDGDDSSSARNTARRRDFLGASAHVVANITERPNNPHRNCAEGASSRGCPAPRRSHARLSGTIADGGRDIYGDDARGVADDAPRCCLLVSTPRRECSEVKCMLEPSFNSILRSGQHSTSRSGRHLKANATPRPGAAHIVLLDRSGRPPV